MVYYFNLQGKDAILTGILLPFRSIEIFPSKNIKHFVWFWWNEFLFQGRSLSSVTLVGRPLQTSPTSVPTRRPIRQRNPSFVPDAPKRLHSSHTSASTLNPRAWSRVASRPVVGQEGWMRTTIATTVPTVMPAVLLKILRIRIVKLPQGTEHLSHGHPCPSNGPRKDI
jgi:hypothetical protein